MPESHIICADRQSKCQKEMETRFLRWRTFALVFGIQVALSIGSYGFTWFCFISGASRATVSETKSVELQRQADKADGRSEGVALTLADVKAILTGIRADLKTVEAAVGRLETRNACMDTPKP